MKRKVCVVTGSRAEYSRIKTVMQNIQQYPDLELQIVVTGSHLLRKYGSTVTEIEADGFPIHAKIFLLVEGDNPITMTKSTGLGLIELATVFDQLKPNIVIAPTDRFETLPVAIAASYMNICVAHIQGGELSGTIDGIVRHVITKFAHLHFPATEKSRENIIRMGEDPKTVFNVGCPATDLVLSTPMQSAESIFMELNEKSKLLKPKEDYLLVLQHPVTTEYGESWNQIQQTLLALKEFDLQVIMLWPNADPGNIEMVTAIRHFFLKHGIENIFVFRHFRNDIFINLMRHTRCMIGNSSAGIRESCYFGTPVVNIGTRQQHREHGANVIDVPYHATKIREAIQFQLRQSKYKIEMLYGRGDAGKQITQILATYPIHNIQKQLHYS